MTFFTNKRFGCFGQLIILRNNIRVLGKSLFIIHSQNITLEKMDLPVIHIYVCTLFFAESFIICSLFAHSVHNDYFNVEYRYVVFIFAVCTSRNASYVSYVYHQEAKLRLSCIFLTRNCHIYIHYRVQGQSQLVLQMYKRELKNTM